jgi:hypothetical protein
MLVVCCPDALCANARRAWNGTNTSTAATELQKYQA